MASASVAPECVFDLYGGTEPSGSGQFDIVVVPATTTSNASSSSYGNGPSHADQLVMLHEAIWKLAALPPSHDMHIDAGTRGRAEEFLNLVSQQGSLPKIFPQDGDALVFTWDIGPRKRMITVTEDEATGMDIDKKSRIRCDFELPLDDPDARRSWLPHVATGILTSSSSTDKE